MGRDDHLIVHAQGLAKGPWHADNLVLLGDVKGNFASFIKEVLERLRSPEAGYDQRFSSSSRGA
jgi:hypothetical protein